jgi:F-type H+-transporting ATPase subunit b
MNNPLIQPDPGLFIWTIITFLVLVGLLAKFAWKPLLRALQSRQESIRRALDDAQKAKEELDRVRIEAAEIIRQARVESGSIFAKARSEADKFGDELRKKAKLEAESIIQNAQQQIQSESRKALQAIRNEAVDLSLMMASKLIKQHITKEDNEKLIAQTLEQLESGEIQ